MPPAGEGGEVGPGPAARPPRAAVPLLLGIAAALCSWNLLVAPFGLVLGLAALGLSLRLLRGRAGRWRWAGAAAAVAASAAGWSGWLLLRTAERVTTELPGQQVVPGRTAAEARALIDAEAARTAPERERVRRELERAESPGEKARKGEGLKSVDHSPRSETE